MPLILIVEEAVEEIATPAPSEIIVVETKKRNTFFAGMVLCRSGCSIYLLVKCARIIVSRMHKNRSSMCSGLPKALLGNTSAGQCHKYSG